MKRKVEHFLRDADPEVRAVLVYGPDAGQVSETAAALIARALGDTDDPFARVELTGAALRDDPARLADEAAALSLMGGPRAVRLRDVTRESLPVIERFLEDMPGHAFVAVEGGDLRPTAPLRTMFERSRTAVALPCYGDEERGVAELIDDVLRARRLGIDGDARRYLVEHLGADRMVSRNELEKLALYVGDGAAGARRVSLDDAIACVGDSAALSLDDLCDAVAGGDQKALERTLGRALGDGNAPVTILRAAARHFQRLHLAAAHRARGASAEAALKALRPPVFYKAAPAFRAQLAAWSTDRLAAALDRLVEAERDCKRTGAPAESICARTLMQLCHGARPRP